jgi:methylenetetrahydrofolate--tRNA-(uracil-5-)-methyltransferase
LTGAEGYTEAIGTGLYAASQILADLRGGSLEWPAATCLGALTRHLTDPNPDFQPMNFNFGLLPKVETAHKKDRKAAQIVACQAAWDGFEAFALQESISGPA